MLRAFFLLVGVASIGCATSLEIEDGDGGSGEGGSASSPTGTAATSTKSSGSTSAGTTTGNPGCVVEQCPGQDEPCHFRACIGDQCGFADAAAGTVCAPTSCSAGVETSGGICDGVGTCQPGMGAMPCEPYVCDAAGVACLTTCASPLDCVSGYVCNGGTCEDTMGVIATYGNSTLFSENSAHSPNFLLGSKLTVPAASLLTHLAVITKAAGPNLKLALYTDSGGLPGTLVAATPSTPMTLGTMELPVTQVALAAGDYWIMGNYDTNASIGFDASDPSPLVAYISLPFASAPPATFGVPLTYNGQRFNYYIKVLQ